MCQIAEWGLVGVLAFTWAACANSPTDPFDDVVAQTMRTEFVLEGAVIAIPVSISNVSKSASYYVWTGPGGLCARLVRVAPIPNERSSGVCSPSEAFEVGPGETLDSEIWIPNEAGTFRLAIRVSDRVGSEVDEHTRTNAFSIRPN